MITKIPFGKTGHQSTRTIFGAAALAAMRQDRADQVLDTLLQYGVNHIDVAASYGDAELRVGRWMPEHRQQFFLATKTGERTAAGARDSIHRSLERLRVDQVDLIQFHNLTDDDDWDTAMGPGGALEAAIEAREQGLVRFIGVTGHGTRVPEMHLRSLERFDFDSVLLPCNYMMMQIPEYAQNFEKLIALCGERSIAVQTIKSIARRRWPDDDNGRHFSWYEPVSEPEALRNVVHWLLSHPGIFLNTSSDATLLPSILQAAADLDTMTTDVDIDAVMRTESHHLQMEPLFVPGEKETI
jgi:aryl-alcohol dehydrogenase-like predicted oxidoreductase|tara:strand:+ start:3926 stop:4819 length:894 start_codon:yes stop_codon:yes gene_type:complete